MKSSTADYRGSIRTGTRINQLHSQKHSRESSCTREGILFVGRTSSGRKKKSRGNRRRARSKSAAGTCVACNGRTVTALSRAAGYYPENRLRAARVPVRRDANSAAADVRTRTAPKPASTASAGMMMRNRARRTGSTGSQSVR